MSVTPSEQPLMESKAKVLHIESGSQEIKEFLLILIMLALNGRWLNPNLL